MLASSVDRDVNGGPVGRNQLCQWFQTLNLSFIFLHLNWCSTAKSRKQFRNINGPSTVVLCLWGKDQVKEMCLEIFFEVSNGNGWTDRQWQVFPNRRGRRVKTSCTCVGLDPRDQQTNFFVWSPWMGWEWCSKHGVKRDGLFFIKGFAGQQTDLEQCSKFYW